MLWFVVAKIYPPKMTLYLKPFPYIFPKTHRFLAWENFQCRKSPCPSPPSSTQTQPPFQKIHLANLEARIWLVVDTSLGGWNERWNEGSGWSMEGTSGNSPNYWVQHFLGRNFTKQMEINLDKWLSLLMSSSRRLFFVNPPTWSTQKLRSTYSWTFLFNQTGLFAHTFLLKGSIQSMKIVRHLASSKMHALSLCKNDDMIL